MEILTMMKLKRKSCRKVSYYQREIFPRKAKDQPKVNLDKLSVIPVGLIEVIEASPGSDYEKNATDHKKQEPKKKCKKNIKALKTENKQNNDHDVDVRCRTSRRNDIVKNTDRSINQKGKKLKSPVLSPFTSGLSCFMELGARTDLLSDSCMADPLGPDSFDNFQWVEVKQELPDDIEVCKITITELPLKIDDDKPTTLRTDNVKEINDAKSYNKGASNATAVNLELVPLVSCSISQNDLSSKIQKSVEADSGACETKDDQILELSLGRDESLDGNSETVEDCEERKSVEHIEEVPPEKKKKDNLHQCDICDKTLYSKGNLRIHKLKMHKLKVQFTCELCSLKFDYHREVVQHRNTVHREEDGRFGCEVCGKHILDYYSYLAHIKCHMDRCEMAEGSDKMCLDCDKGFQDDKSLRIHQALEHTLDLRGRLKGQEKNFICDSCGRRFVFSCLLRDHINTHTGVKPYLCQKCGKAFCQKSTLKQHTKTHSDVRPFQCSECPQGFYSKGDYIKHQRKHTGERPYVCEVCGEGFSRSTHLVIHRRIHTGERPHICDICERGFTKRGDVVRHRRVHTGELPYLCQVCGKAFRQSTQCANHIKSQHPDSPALVARNPNPLVQHGVHVQLLC